MKLFVDQLDIARTRANWPEGEPFAPALVRHRGRDDQRNWVVLAAPLEPGREPQWFSAKHDEYVRVPLYPYLLGASGDLALAHMLQLGLTCAGRLPGRVEAAHIVTGVPVELLYAPHTAQHTGMRFWIGFAIVMERT